MPRNTGKPTTESVVWPIGSLSPGKPGKHHVEPRWFEGETPTFICNASSREPLKLSEQWTSAQRPGSDHSQYKSRGIGC